MSFISREDFIKTINTLLGYPNEHVNVLIIPVIEKFFSYAVKLKDSTDFVNISMTRTITALRHRRGHMLPAGATTEIVALQEAVWTYAVFTSALLWEITQKKCNENHKAILFAEEFLPPLGLAWLKSYSTVYDAWKVVLLNADKSRNVMELILMAINKIPVSSLPDDAKLDATTNLQNNIQQNIEPEKNKSSFNFDKFISSL